MHFAAALAIALLADPWCSEITKLAEAGKEQIPFQSFRDAKYSPKLLSNGCFPGGVGYFCQQSGLPADVTLASTSKRIAACIPGAKITVEKPRNGLSQGLVSGAGLEFELEESGRDGAGEGRVMRIQITTDR